MECTAKQIVRIEMELLTLQNESRRLELERERKHIEWPACSDSLDNMRHSVLQAIADIVAGKEF